MVFLYVHDFFEGSIKDFNKAIQLNPNYAKAYYQRSIMIHPLSYDKAISGLSKVINLEPNNGEAFLLRGTYKLFKNKGINNESSYQDFKKAYALGKEEAYGMMVEYCMSN